MQVHHIYTELELTNLTNNILSYFKSKEELSNYWFSHSRREIDKFSKEIFKISYFIFKRIINNYFNLSDRTPDQFNKIGKQHREQTLVDKYGNKNAFQFGSVEHKKVVFAKYGVENVFQAEEVKNKIKKTKVERYNNKYFLNREKYKKTCLERYGKIPNLFGSEDYYQNMLNKFGVKHYSQTLESHHKRHPLYSYDNEHFDSFPELCFYLYHKINNIEIIRCPIKLSYIFNEKEYYYIPDFKVNNTLIEIKGDHLLNEDGSFRPIFGEREKGITEAKYKCALDNKVLILSSKEYQKYIDWFYKNEYKREDFIV